MNVSWFSLLLFGLAATVYVAAIPNHRPRVDRHQDFSALDTPDWDTASDEPYPTFYPPPEPSSYPPPEPSSQRPPDPPKPSSYPPPEPSSERPPDPTFYPPPEPSSYPPPEPTSERPPNPTFYPPPDPSSLPPPDPTTEQPSKAGKVVCYVTNTAADRPGFAKFMPDDLDPTLCTHAVYAFAGVDADYNVVSLNPDVDLDNEEGGSYGGYRKFVQLRDKNPDMKALLGVGGYDAETNGLFSQMAQETHSRQIFIDNVVEFLSNYGFDGINIDWYFPGNDPLERDNLAKLLQEFYFALEETNLSISIAVSAKRDVIDHGYNVPRISDVVEFMSIMAYDFHTCKEKYTHHHTPLGSTYEDEGDNQYYNVMSAVEYFIEKGASPEKLLLGIPTYGRTYSLDDTTDTGLYSTAICGLQGAYTRQPGLMSYFEVCDKMDDYWDFRNVTFENDLSSPYAVYDFSGTESRDQWISMDDRESIEAKCNIVSSLHFGGVMVWSADNDDFLDWCREGPFPILRLAAQKCAGR